MLNKTKKKNLIMILMAMNGKRTQSGGKIQTNLTIMSKSKSIIITQLTFNSTHDLICLIIIIKTLSYIMQKNDLLSFFGILIDFIINI